MAEKLSINYLINKPKIWLPGLIISVLLLSFVIGQVEYSTARSILNSINLVPLSIALLFLILEGITTSIRLWLFTGKKSCISEALKANAWYVFFLVILPARLGEVVAVFIFQKYLKQKFIFAATSIITQRLYDIIILSTFFLIGIVGLGGAINEGFIIWFAIALVITVSIVLFKLNSILTVVAYLLGNNKKNKFFMKLYRLVVQARVYNRSTLSQKDLVLVYLITSLKWFANISALTFLFAAINLNLDLFKCITIASSYNFLAIIPLQTMGGIGIGEAGLMLLLTGASVPMSVAASGSLIVRFVLLIFPFIFISIVYSGLMVKKKVVV